MICAHRSKILADCLQRAAENFCDAAGVRRQRSWRRADSRKIGIRGRRGGPKVQQWLNTRNGGGPGLEVRHKRSGSLMKVLPKAFVVSEGKCFVLSNGPAEGGPELIPLKRRSIPLIEEVWRVQSVISQKLEERPV